MSRGWEFWSGKRDSNSRPQSWQGCALPTELFPHNVSSCPASLRPVHQFRQPPACVPVKPLAGNFIHRMNCFFRSGQPSCSTRVRYFSDALPISWETVELRIDEMCHLKGELTTLGVNIGDFVAFDSAPEISPSGYINARYLDDKAGVATVLAVAKSILDNKLTLPIDCHLLFTISEEVGSGASAILHQDVAEMVSIDTGPSAPGQSTDEYGVTICVKDSVGPFDYHLTHHLIELCKESNIPFKRDVFKHYRCDSASAIEAGNDIRTALVCFGADATHGYERCHEKSLDALGKLLLNYLMSEQMFKRDKDELGSLQDFPSLPIEME